MKVCFAGCGDAFGSGGRFNTCFHVCGEKINLLIDCGASSLIALKQNGISPNDIRTILITHFHADHFGGVPAFVLDAMFVSKRQQPLTIIGPPGISDMFVRATEAAYLGSSRNRPRFELTFLDIAGGSTVRHDGLEVTAFAVRHGEPAGQSLGFRIATEGRVVAYSGDTEWLDCLIDLGQRADLYIIEAYTRHKKLPGHMDLASIEQHAQAIGAKRIILTHLSPDMLEHKAEVQFECAFDGLVIDL